MSRVLRKTARRTKPATRFAVDALQVHGAPARGDGARGSRAETPALPECRPASWAELVDVLFNGSFDQDLRRYRSPFVFRGTTRPWPLTPSLHRMGHTQDLLTNIEKGLIRSFKKYAYHEISGQISDWKWLSIAQHHGLPTRLLDWTFSPFVGLHFATDRIDHMNDDGVVWMLNFIECRRWLPQPLLDLLHQHFAWGFNVDMLEERFNRVQALEEMKGHDPEFVVFFEPPSLDPRIINQFGLFSLMNRPHTDLNQWLESKVARNPTLVRRVIIDASLKWEIRDKLDQMNLTERVIYPGLDGLSQWLKRWYSPANPQPAPAAASGVVRADGRTPRRLRTAARKRKTGARRVRAKSR